MSVKCSTTICAGALPTDRLPFKWEHVEAATHNGSLPEDDLGIGLNGRQASHTNKFVQGSLHLGTIMNFIICSAATGGVTEKKLGEGEQENKKEEKKMERKMNVITMQEIIRAGHVHSDVWWGRKNGAPGRPTHRWSYFSFKNVCCKSHAVAARAQWLIIHHFFLFFPPFLFSLAHKNTNFSLCRFWRASI